MQIKAVEMVVTGIWLCLMAVMPRSTERHFRSPASRRSPQMEWWRIAGDIHTCLNIWSAVLLNANEVFATINAWRKRRLAGGIGHLAQTPANTMRLDTIACITAIRAVGNDGDHVNGSAAKGACEQTGKCNSDGTYGDHLRFCLLGVSARNVSPMEPMT